MKRLFLLSGIMLVVAIIFILQPTTQVKKYDEKEFKISTKNFKQRDQPNLAIQQNNEMTMDPKLGYPPIERMVSAFNKLKKNRDSRQARGIPTEQVTWVERGPNNVSGRTRALMFDPTDSESKKVWAGAIGGGIWYNNDITDPAQSWNNVNDFLANIAISALAYDPTNTSTFYASTGLGYTEDIRGAGIFKSEDAGSTWTQLPSTDNEEFYFIQNLKITDEGRLIASTTEGVYISDDDGDSWARSLAGRAGDLEIASDGTVYLTLGVGSPGGIYKSLDDGVTWDEITPEDQITPQRIEIASAPSNPDVLYAVADRVGGGDSDVAWFYRSDDAGDTWTSITIPEYLDAQTCESSGSHFTRGQAFFDLIIGVHPEIPEKIIVGGIDLHTSDDAGVTWRPISYWTGSFCDAYVHADQHAFVFRPGYPNEAIAGSDGGVSYSNDVGFANNPNFETRIRGYNVTTYYAATAANEAKSNYFLAGAQDNGTQRYTEPFLNNTTEATGGDGAFCFIDEDDSNIQISSFVFNSYRLSQDGGKTFVSISNDQSRGRFINPSEYDSETNILYGAGDVGEITRIANISTDVDPSTLELETISVDLSGSGDDQRQITTIKASPHTANRLFVGVRIFESEGLLFIIDDADTDNPTVTEITGSYSGSHGGWVSSIDVGETDDHLIATFSNYGVSSVYETTDGGSSWLDRNGDLPDMPVRWGVFNPNDRTQVFIATELGVWSTEDVTAESPDWEPTNTGLANVRTDMIKVRPVDNLLYAATYGRGLFTSNVLNTQASADFDAPQIGYVGVPVSFKDLSTNANENWSWDFGDGGSSNAQNPAHTYDAVGTYGIMLSIDNGAATESKINYLTILPSKTAPYAAADGGDFESNQSDFASISLLNDVDIWEVGTPSNSLATAPSGSNVWKTDLDAALGDPGFDFSSAIYTPSFDLSTPGNYSLKFNLEMEIVYCNAPSAVQVQYSTDSGEEWTTLGSSYPGFGISNWYNRGDNTGCSIEFDLFPEKVGWAINSDGPLAVEHTLNDLVGNENVAFRIVYAQSSGSSANSSGNDPYDQDGVLIDDFEITYAAPTADFTLSNAIGFTGSPLTFNYESNGATSFAWDFGDGNSSTDENPTHVYQNSGSYTISLTITSDAGTDTKERSVLILPNLAVPYEIEDGGNLEVNQNHFGVENISGTPFELGNSSVSGKDGTNSGNNAWVTGLNDSEYVDNSEAYLYTPVFDFLNQGNYSISFFANFDTEINWDGFIVQYSSDLGGSWVKLNPNREDGWYNTTSDPQSVFGASVPIFSGSTGGYQEFGTDLTFLAGNESVVFRFQFLTDANLTEPGIAIDDISVIGPEPGPGVPQFSVENAVGCSGRTVTFTNESTGSISSFEWDFGENADPATASGVGPHEVIYEGDATSTVTLTINSSVNGITTAESTVVTSAIHEPTLVREFSNGSYILTASAGDSYEWYRDGVLLEGETGQTLDVSLGDGGEFSVLVSIGACSVLTEELLVNSVLDEVISIYPNPASESIQLKAGVIIQGFYKIYDINGKVVDSNSINQSTDLIDIRQLDDGIYLLKLTANNETILKRVIVRK